MSLKIDCKASCFPKGGLLSAMPITLKAVLRILNWTNCRTFSKTGFLYFKSWNCFKFLYIASDLYRIRKSGFNALLLLLRCAMNDFSVVKIFRLALNALLENFTDIFLVTVLSASSVLVAGLFLNTIFLSRVNEIVDFAVTANTQPSSAYSNPFILYWNECRWNVIPFFYFFYKTCLIFFYLFIFSYSNKFCFK